ncbi:hypothetical protein RIF23_03230 [Lipingzhangella sp. LS1_29]|uniref:Tyr recombinase domain-containing protein n=1 Tax=Lipingzhangella rawalii TaxID=2055835 RepID=A0ABU2H1Y4_9ACTN|nr:hypothetical protein [Lipingzhangella rawalii]MDS1269306.1 hypothetical protein [Lipingzhangella rawalii]
METLANTAAELRTKYNQTSAASSVNRALIRHLAYTGLRWSEAPALRANKVDLDKRRIRVSVAF